MTEVKKHKYYFSSASQGERELTSAPRDWEKKQFEYNRSDKYKGLTRKVSTDSLIFLNKERKFLEAAYQAEGTEGICEFIDKKLNPDNGYIYEEIFRGEVDFYTRKKTRKTFEVVVNDSSFEQKVLNRSGNDIILDAIKTISGQDMDPMEYRKITLPALKTILSTTYTLTERDYQTVEDNPDKIFEINSVIAGSDDNGSQKDGQPFYIANSSTQINMSGKIVFEAYIDTDAPQVNVFQIRIKKNNIIVKNINAKFINRIPLYKSGGYYLVKARYEVELEYSEDLTTNDGVSMDLEYIGSGHLDSIAILLETEYFISALKISQYSDLEVDAVMYHEAFSRVVNAISDRKDALVSNFLGRTDIPNTNRTYYTEGEGAFTCLINGKLIRNFPKTSALLSTSLDDLFQTVGRIWPLGMSVETDPLDRTKKVLRIENRRYFYQDLVIITIDNASDIVEETYTELLHNEIEAGYKKSDYEEKLGFLEYNNSVKYNNTLRTTSDKAELTVAHRADGTGIQKAREKQYYEFPNEDTKYDEANWIINLTKDGDKYRARTNQGFSYVSGVPDPSGAINLLFTPTRNILRFGEILRVGLDKYANTYLRFAKSEKNSNLVTRLDTEQDNVSESSDIPVSELNTPYLSPDKVSFKATVDNETIKTLDGYTGGIPNIYGLIRYRGSELDEYEYGWILNIKASDETGKGEFTLVKPNLKYVIPYFLRLAVDYDDVIFSDSNDVEYVI